jgi:flagellar basal-body rod modification protein FlgD
MATGIAGIWNQLAATSPAKTTPPVRSETTSDANSTANGSSAAISANDFLTLLVTEMKNQDPTANTDPNEYINQLVQVNSLEQLISINQTLLTDSGASATGDATHRSGVDPLRASVTSSKRPASTASTSPIASAPSVTGNLSIPNIDPAALRVAGALAGHSQTR